MLEYQLLIYLLIIEISDRCDRWYDVGLDKVIWPDPNPKKLSRISCFWVSSGGSTVQRVKKLGSGGLLRAGSVSF